MCDKSNSESNHPIDSDHGVKTSQQRFKQSSSWGVDDLWVHEIHEILIVLGFTAKSDCDDVRIYVPKTILVADLVL